MLQSVKFLTNQLFLHLPPKFGSHMIMMYNGRAVLVFVS